MSNPINSIKKGDDVWLIPYDKEKIYQGKAGSKYRLNSTRIKINKEYFYCDDDVLFTSYREARICFLSSEIDKNKIYNSYNEKTIDEEIEQLKNIIRSIKKSKSDECHYLTTISDMEKELKELSGEV